jgi:hypothetical protein
MHGQMAALAAQVKKLEKEAAASTRAMHRMADGIGALESTIARLSILQPGGASSEYTSSMERRGPSKSPRMAAERGAQETRQSAAVEGGGAYGSEDSDERYGRVAGERFSSRYIVSVAVTSFQ